MHIIFKFVSYIIVLASVVNGLKDLPAYFPRCKRTDPNMQECLIKATEEVRPYMTKGVPDFLPSFQSFTIPKISLEQGTRSVNYKAYIENITLLGLDGYKFTRYEFFEKNLTFLLDVKIPSLFMKGKYKLDGKILIASIQGDGDFHANMTDTICSIYHEVEVVSKNGIEYLKPTVTIPKIRIGNVVDYALEGLFKENKELAEATGKFIRDNLKQLIEELIPAVEKVLGAIFTDGIFQKVTQIPYDKLYPK